MSDPCLGRRLWSWSHPEYLERTKMLRCRANQADYALGKGRAPPSGRYSTFQAIHCRNAAWDQVGRHFCHLAPDERMSEHDCTSMYHSFSTQFNDVLIFNVICSTVWEMQLLNIFPSCPVALYSPDQQCDLEMQDQIPWLTRLKLTHPSPHILSKDYDQELDQDYAPNASHILILYQYAVQQNGTALLTVCTPCFHLRCHYDPGLAMLSHDILQSTVLFLYPWTLIGRHQRGKATNCKGGTYLL